jgi:hypothetical protein
MTISNFYFKIQIRILHVFVLLVDFSNNNVNKPYSKFGIITHTQ